jgi:CheY-like chemotaxis protein/DNA-binding XRE family transcriptional regulator
MHDSEIHHSLDLYIGKRIRESRQKQGLTLNDVGEKIGVSHQQIQKYEQGQARLSAIALYQMGRILGVDTHYFFRGFEHFTTKDEVLKGDIIIPDRERALNILLVEDDPADELLTRRALDESSISVKIFALHDGVAVLDFLRRRTTQIDFPRPDIIILDLNIPKRDGHTVLKELKRDRDLCDIPVIILTNSINFQEMMSCYRQHASGYICKSFDFDVFQQSLEHLVLYWARAVALPHRSCGEY